MSRTRRKKMSWVQGEKLKPVFSTCVWYSHLNVVCYFEIAHSWNQSAILQRQEKLNFIDSLFLNLYLKGFCPMMWETRDEHDIQCWSRMVELQFL
jgi:hypothetical protein